MEIIKFAYLCSCKSSKQHEDMATVTAIPSQSGRLMVDFEDISMLRDIKKAISMVRGVTKVTVPRSRRMSSYERSMRDLDEGRVYEYDSLDDLVKEIEG